MAVPFDTERFRKTCTVSYNASGCAGASGERLSSGNLGRTIDAYGREIGAANSRVAGSLFMKRYSPVIVGALYLRAHHGMAVDVAPELVGVEREGASLRFSIGPELFSPDMEDTAYLRHLFAENACPVIGQIASHTGIGEATLWATLSYLLVYRFEEWLQQAETPALRERIGELYRCLAERADPEWFPGRKGIPLTTDFRRVRNPLRESEPIMVRSKCCLSCRLPGDDRYCYTCPLLSDARRLEKYAGRHG